MVRMASDILGLESSEWAKFVTSEHMDVCVIHHLAGIVPLVYHESVARLCDSRRICHLARHLNHVSKHVPCLNRKVLQMRKVFIRYHEQVNCRGR